MEAFLLLLLTLLARHMEAMADAEMHLMGSSGAGLVVQVLLECRSLGRVLSDLRLTPEFRVPWRPVVRTECPLNPMKPHLDAYQYEPQFAELL